MMNTKKQRAIFKLAKIQHDMFFNSRFEDFEKKFPRASRKRRVRAKWAKRFATEESGKPFYVKLNDKLSLLKSRLEKSRCESQGEFHMPPDILRELERLERIEKLAKAITVAQLKIGEEKLVVPAGAKISADMPGVRIIEYAPPENPIFGFTAVM